ncbi:nuclear transport factor 2 family protein [Naasia lichenicola]|uniref:Nuclear transport factor 2 family protein n=1 Tax=Naasia lichenicola TaxID=2565933 RepID=A0A4S4FS70_9MICO|nr:nuclear transport factor 2 family protein [Naasia lichenicola]THG33234.1 nuclear transport factor 2 family protein [Naasia lichenicola]
MASRNETAARALSGHRFGDAFPFLAQDVQWDVVGMGLVDGRDEAIAACTTLQTELVGTEVEFDSFRAIEDGDTVVVDSVATYTDQAGGFSKVSSCDIYDFKDGLIVSIRSYNVELEATIDVEVAD